MFNPQNPAGKDNIFTNQVLLNYIIFIFLNKSLYKRYLCRPIK